MRALPVASVGQVNTVERIARAGAATAVVLALASCQAPGAQSPADEANQPAESMGNAVPVASPPAADPAGTVYPYDAVTDLDASGDLLAVRTADSLRLGTLQEVTSGGGARYELDPDCGPVSGQAGRFAVACGATVRVFDHAGEENFSTDAPATVAAPTSSGEVVAGSGSEREVRVYRDGDEIDSFPVARETDQLITVAREGQPDAALRVNHFDTTVQDLDLAGGRQGGTLRAGLGVGGVASGGDGLVLAADNTGDQLLVYTVSDVVRLQQSAPVAQSPWAVAWDGESGLAWVTSTATNEAAGYDISHGTPIQRASVPTVADATSMVALDDGTLVIASASGGGVQVVRPEDTESATR